MFYRILRLLLQDETAVCFIGPRPPPPEDVCVHAGSAISQNSRTALHWLKQNNPLYKNIIISEPNLDSDSTSQAEVPRLNLRHVPVSSKIAQRTWLNLHITPHSKTVAWKSPAEPTTVEATLDTPVLTTNVLFATAWHAIDVSAT
ncbi:hypothetical protein DFS34DRAFT_517120 [Phlyctochytrium arcticum]|nr:hypothetical protein DFS34DRAFT_517120 [Phlyctochytrium arcticum]